MAPRQERRAGWWIGRLPHRLDNNQAVDQPMALLDALRFMPGPRSADDRGRIGLRHCPFLELVETQAQVICPLHLGLMQGAMATLGTCSWRWFAHG
jgi:predicted ArsR family transcriptional regulator